MKRTAMILSQALMTVVALTSASASADGLVQIVPGTSIVVSVYDGTTTVQCVGGGPVQPTTQYLCTARCHAGNNYAYDRDVQDYFVSRTRGVHERLLSLCVTALPESQRNGASISKMACNVAQ